MNTLYYEIEGLKTSAQIMVKQKFPKMSLV